MSIIVTRLYLVNIYSQVSVKIKILQVKEVIKIVHNGTSFQKCQLNKLYFDLHSYIKKEIRHT